MATADVRWWSFMQRDFREARQLYKALLRSGAYDPTQMRADYRELLAIAEARRRIAANREYQAVAGPHFAGPDTAFATLASVAAWYMSTRASLMGQGRFGAPVLRAVWELPADTIAGLLATDGPGKERTARLRAAVFAVRAVRGVIGSQRLTNAEWSDLQAVCAALTSLLYRAHELLLSLRVPTDLRITDRRELVRVLAEIRGLRMRIEGAAGVANVLGTHFAGVATDLEAIRRSLEFFDEVGTTGLPLAVRNWILQPEAMTRTEQLRQSYSLLASACASARHTWAEFAAAGGVQASEWFGSQQPVEESELARLESRCRLAADNAGSLPAWLDYLSATSDLQARELGFLVVLCEREQLNAEELPHALDFVRANSLVEEAFHSQPQLARFSGLSHDELRLRFATLDKECIRLYRKRAAAVIARRDVPSGVGYGPAAAFTERNLLSREIAKQKRHIPLRALVRRAGNALQALKPCFMLGPLSVAQYLQPGTIEFDLLIVDEASQLRPEDSLGAIARVRQVVIVGDQMQLPPTSFFDRLGEEPVDEDEESAAIEDAESILDVATALYQPARMLRWHYRSRHGSLIAFSNKEFYKNDLVVFPSPAPKSKSLGVKFVHVPEGRFDARRNRAEADRIVGAAMRHMELRRSETLGIVAMNAPQRELIEELLQGALKRHPLAEEYTNSPPNPLEPLFVKNLENVQGDERDVIYISATYGRNASGHFHQRFGPITGPTGHRRLNVLFTRARRRVVLFSSMTADDITVQPGSSRGVVALKSYLAYAASGILETALFTGREADSDFEIEVASALRHRGFDVVAQVGVAGYFIDLAVKHPDRADAFILGIECDGATYHSSLSARDRDRLRQAVLEDLGWHIHRVWSTDWFKQRDREVDRIVGRIDQASL
jgi:very-short-patch-repair endonuclease